MPFLNRLSDERLLAKNLRNIRIAFVVQTLGVLAVLGYEWIKNGSRAMFDEPLHLVLLVTLTVYMALTIPIARENEEQ
ncbi:hypothetical protein ACKFRU_02285 [Corynebacterium tuberculostearicum]|uniref:hypothetical protein n=1 Tax=Corynebacterium TaxID=1716 RepID=UPI00254FC142|nr:hypothetical protein [Corynebacterium sp. MSK195]MDK8670823.1 hypothetical protein [Corynebacterium sp. MSK195]